MRSLRDMLKKAVEMGNSLSVRASTGEPGVSLFSGTFERQTEGSGNGASLINLTWASFWTQIMLGI